MVLELLQNLVGKLQRLDQGSLFMFKKWYEYRYKETGVETLPAKDIADCIKVAEKLAGL
jgi:hypothetical protein